MDYEKNMDKMRRYQKEFGRYNARKKAFFRNYFRMYHRLEVRGVERVPEGPALVVANHGGGYDLDIVALTHFCHPSREIHVLIAEQWHYLNSMWGRYYIGSGIPLWTRGGIRWEYMDPFLGEGGDDYPSLVAMYPEGRSGSWTHRRRLNTFYPGVVRIALRYRVPLVPAAQVGFHNACPIFFEIERDHAPDDPVCLPFTLPAKLRCEFGEPFELSEYYVMTLDRAEEYWVANNIVRPRLAAVLSNYFDVNLEEPLLEMREPGERVSG